MKSNTKLDPDLFVGRPRFNGRVWRTASSYRDAANTLYDTDLISFCHPILMNYAFSCEIAAKACCVQTQYNCKPTGNGLIPTACAIPIPHGHDLIKVFEQLPNETKTAIANTFKDSVGIDLRSQLIEFRDYFDVRYYFEKRPHSHSLSGIRELSNGFVDSTLEAAKASNGFASV